MAADSFSTTLATALASAAAGVGLALCLRTASDAAASATPDAPPGQTTLTYWNGRGCVRAIRARGRGSTFCIRPRLFSRVFTCRALLCSAPPRRLAEAVRFMLAVCGEDYAERVPPGQAWRPLTRVTA